MLQLLYNIRFFWLKLLTQYSHLSLTSKLPSDFIRSIRLKRAAQLLDKSGMPIVEVAYQLGFINPEVFTKLKEELWLPPSKYATNGKNRNAE